MIQYRFLFVSLNVVAEGPTISCILALFSCVIMLRCSVTVDCCSDGNRPGLPPDHLRIREYYIFHDMRTLQHASLDMFLLENMSIKRALVPGLAVTEAVLILQGMCWTNEILRNSLEFAEHITSLSTRSQSVGIPWYMHGSSHEHRHYSVWSMRRVWSYFDSSWSWFSLYGVRTRVLWILRERWAYPCSGKFSRSISILFPRYCQFRKALYEHGGNIFIESSNQGGVNRCFPNQSYVLQPLSFVAPEWCE